MAIVKFFAKNTSFFNDKFFGFWFALFFLSIELKYTAEIHDSQFIDLQMVTFFNSLF